MTTCFHSSMVCRPRINDYNIEGFNITPWTVEEKFKIAQITYKSLIEFIGDENSLSIIDDGSNLKEANAWLNDIKSKTNKVYQYTHRGSSQGINDYYKTIPNDIDVIFHCEDDHLIWNPENLDWKQICYEFLKENPDIGVVTLRSGLPSATDRPDYKGAWGPIGFRNSNYNAIIYNNMGNAHHIMLKKTYDRFFPLQGNAGSCEAYMNNKLHSLGLLNAELQIPVYAFHSHCYSRPLPDIVTTTELNKSPIGIEYGIKNMYEYIHANHPINYSYFISPQEEIHKCYV